MKDKTFRFTFISDFKRVLRVPMLIAILAVSVGFIFDNYSDLKVVFKNLERAKETISVFYFYFNSVSFGGMFSRYLFALLAALPAAAEYAGERRSGMMLYLIHKSGLNNYGVSKMLTSALAGGFVLCLGSLLFLALLSTQLQLVVSSNLTEFVWLPYYSLLDSSGGAPYFAAAQFLLFLTGALWASVATCVSAFIPDQYVVTASPFLLSFFLIQFSRLLNLPDIARLDLLLCGRAQWGTDIVSLLRVGFVVVLIVAVLTFTFCQRVKEEVQNGSD